MLKKTLSFLLAMAMLLSLCQTTIMTASAACAHENKVEVSVLREGTCTVQGISKFQCQDCHVFLYQVTGLKHTWNEGEVVVEPSCGKDGQIKFTCDCGATKTEVIPTNVEHNWVPSVDASCEYPAMKGRICSNCYATEGEIIYSGKPLGHKEVKTLTKEPTCDKAGEYTITCEVCKKELRKEPAASGHKFGEPEFVDATCTEPGYLVEVCVRCDYEKKTPRADLAPMLGHDTTHQISAEKAATCTEKGVSGGYLCERCGGVVGGKETDVDPNNHGENLKLVDTLKKPSCNEIGLGKYVCSACNVVKYQTIDKTHMFDAGVVIKEATCKAEGQIRYTCQNPDCNAVVTKPIPKIDHNYVTYLPATCEKPAYVGEFCSICLYGKKTAVGEPLSKDGKHTFDIVELISYVDCKTARTQRVTCSVCGFSKIETKTGHVDGEKVFVPAGCDNAMYITYCELCEEPSKKEDLGYLGPQYVGKKHAYVTETIAATCRDPEITVKVCKNCGDEKIINKGTQVDKNNHAEADLELVRVLTPATCVKDGAGVFRCTYCGAENLPMPIKGEHLLDEGYVLVAPTCDKVGTMVYNCTRPGCDFMKTEKIDMIDHDLEEVYVAATCQEAAKTGVACKNCNYKDLEYVVGSTKDPNAHVWNLEKPDVKEATCEEDGSVTYTCKLCGATSEPQTIEAPGSHAWGKWTTVHATCNSDAQQVRECTRCHETETMAPVIPEKRPEHSYEKIPAKAPTCKEPGNTAGEVCSVCGDVKTDYEGLPVDKNAHVYEETTLLEATCSSKGMVKKTCKLCGVSTTETTDLKPHNLDPKTAIVTKAATCTETGKVALRCADCGVWVSEDIDATGHSFGAEKQDGNVFVKVCSVCGVEEKVNCVNKHDPVPYSVPGTCVTKELTGGEKCSVCGTILKKPETVGAINPDNHNFGAPEAGNGGVSKQVCKDCGYEEYVPHLCNSAVTVERKEPTCLEAGYEAYDACSICNAPQVAVKILPALGHNKVAFADEATCTKEGKKGGLYCKNCGYVYEEPTVTPATGHGELIESQPGQEATCTEPGYTPELKCDVCKEVVSKRQFVPALSHKWQEFGGKDATCEEDGLTVGSRCERCGKKVAEQVIPALGHKWETIEGQAPTCVEDGFEAYEQCSVCQAIKGEIVGIPATGHTEVELEAKAPTCTETGLTAGVKCSVCEEILVAQEEIPALGHTPVTAEGKEPTCTEPGMKAGTICEVCGEILEAEEIIPATGHTLVKIEGVPATCETAGKTEGEKCSVCGEITIAQVDIPAIGHSWKYKGVGRDADGFAYIVYVCGNCGAERTVSYK